MFVRVVVLVRGHVQLLGYSLIVMWVQTSLLTTPLIRDSRADRNPGARG